MQYIEVEFDQICEVNVCKLDICPADPQKEALVGIDVAAYHNGRLYISRKINDPRLFGAVCENFRCADQQNDLQEKYMVVTADGTLTYYQFQKTYSCSARMMTEAGSYQADLIRLANKMVWVKFPPGNFPPRDYLADIRKAVGLRFKQEICALENPAREQKEDETRFGRKKDAQSNSVIYFRPRQVVYAEHELVKEKSKADDGEQQKTNKIIKPGSITTIQLEVLSWVNRLRYVTSDMLVALLEAGLISCGGVQYNPDKVKKKILAPLGEYGLLDFMRFATLDENGELIQDAATQSIARFISLGKEGRSILQQMNEEGYYNTFDRLQDGNVVKAILAANQWLIYWLHFYPDMFRERFEAGRMVYNRHVKDSGVRLYASVTRGETTIIGEPVRRSDHIEFKQREEREKLDGLFALCSASPGSLFCSDEPVSFPGPIVICLICEDEAHIGEVYQNLLPQLQLHAEREVWFTTDLKMRNYSEEGRRFYRYTPDGERQIVDIRARLELREALSYLSNPAYQALEQARRGIVQDRADRQSSSIQSLQEITAIHVEMLSWLNELRYMTADMFDKLASAGLIPKAAGSFDDVLEWMNKYKQIDFFRLIVIRSQNLHNTSSIWDRTRICLLGKPGETLLQELGREHGYSVYERFKDGTAVKAVLAVNQWLVYWLSTYPDVFSDHYAPSRVIHIRNVQESGARLYATIACGDITVIGEPVRRDEQNDRMQTKVCGKFERFLAVFAADKELLYCSLEERIALSERPIICYICEDDAHMEEVYHCLRPLLQDNPAQEVWYTTDERVCLDHSDEARFYIFATGRKTAVDVHSRLSLGACNA